MFVTSYQKRLSPGYVPGNRYRTIKGNLFYLSRLAFLIALVQMALGTFAHAVDGVIEINQACATVGCVPGDTPGMPVTLNSPGSYRLTSDLVSSNIAISGIVVNTNDASIDLNGYSVAGPRTSCNPTCTTGNGRGIQRATLETGHRITVQNGSVRGFGSRCIQLNSSAEIRNLMVHVCGDDGISVGVTSLVEANRVISVNGHGIFFGENSGARANIISGIGLFDGPSARSISGGRRLGGNICEAGDCSPRGKPMYYLTPDSIYTSATAASACEAGFHFASLWEVSDPSNLQYDILRGATRTPPTGTPATASPELGYIRKYDDVNADCQNWSSSDSNFSGPTLKFEPSLGSPATGISPWDFGSVNCANTRRVWCFED